MKTAFHFLISLSATFAVIVQFFLMLENRTEGLMETIIRFFSFFTILTNSLVAIYFSRVCIKSLKSHSFEANIKSLSAITGYIVVVGLVYQVALRHIWTPTGMQMLVDELLHSAVPLLVLIYWLFHSNKRDLNWNALPSFLIYPLVYLAFILLRGHFSDFYPYPFIDVNVIGWQQAGINILVLVGVFILLFASMIASAKFFSRKQR